MMIQYHPSFNLPMAAAFSGDILPTQHNQINMCVTEEVNQNLTANQKLFLK